MSTSLRQRLTQDLELAGLSESTHEADTCAIRQLAEHDHTPPHRHTEAQLHEYFLHLKNDRHFAAASLAGSRMCGVTAP